VGPLVSSINLPVVRYVVVVGCWLLVVVIVNVDFGVTIMIMMMMMMMRNLIVFLFVHFKIMFGSEVGFGSQL
jgi:hypothetical protein